MRVRLNPPADTLSRDGEAILLYPGEAVRLAGISAEIVRLAVEPVTMEHLAHCLEARFGAPEHASLIEALTAVVDALVSRGVLTLDPETS